MFNVELILKKNYQNFYDKYPKIISAFVTHVFRSVLHEREINDFMAQNVTKGIGFVEKILESYNVSYSVKSSEIENIPALGSVVVISNHPLGGMDSLILLKMIADARHDKKVKIVANDMLMAVPALKDLLIPVNNIDGKISKQSRKDIIDALENEEAVIFFPSGEVSRASVTGIKKERWKSGFVKMARATNAPILPIHLDAKNSWSFYLLSSVYKPFGTLLLSHEMLKPKQKVIKPTIGELIPNEAFNSRAMSPKEYTELFKKHLFRLSRGKQGVFMTQKCIAHPQLRHILKAELQKAKLLGFTNDQKKIFLVDYDQAPSVMAEIGRLREFSFRKVGEGTGAKRDLDKFDSYYKHLVLWDENDLEIVGAYRIGQTDDIIKKFTANGLYMNELCHLEDSFLDIADKSVELGRSFVQPKYWGSRALDYLWQGIGAYLRAYPQVKYLYGPVSITASYPQAAKDVLVYFYRRYFKVEKNFFTAHNSYHCPSTQLKNFDEMFIGLDYKENLAILKEYLKNFDATVPTLYKQYSELCEEGGVSFSDFGLDEDFADCIDGYIMVNMDMVKSKKRERYFSKEDR